MELSQTTVKRIRELIVFAALVVVFLWKYEAVMKLLFVSMRMIQRTRKLLKNARHYTSSSMIGSITQMVLSDIMNK